MGFRRQLRPFYVDVAHSEQKERRDLSVSENTTRGQQATHLNLALLATCSLEITASNPLGHQVPQLPCFPFRLFLDGFDCDVFLGTSDVSEDFSLSTVGLGNLMPKTLNRMSWRTLAWRSEGCLECVGFTGEIAFAFILDG